MKRRWKGRLANLSILAVATAVCLVALEWGLRASGVADRLGWNSVPPVEERARAANGASSAAVRIVGLGDSFPAVHAGTGKNLFGFTERLARTAGHDVTVINLSEGGTGIRRYRDNLMRFGPALKPDVVVVAIYLGNDLLDYELEQHRTDRKAEPTPEPATWRPSGVGAFIKRHSILAGFAFRLAKRYLPILRSDSFARNLETLTDTYGEYPRIVDERLAAVEKDLVEAAKSDMVNSWDLVFAAVRPGLYADMLGIQADTLFPDALSPMLADLDEIIAWCETAGARSVFLLIPPSIQVSTRYHDYYRRLGYRFDAAIIGAQPLNQELATYFAERNVVYLDLLPVFQSSAAPLYLANDIHWNRDGHRVAAEALNRLLETHGYYNANAR